MRFIFGTIDEVISGIFLLVLHFPLLFIFFLFLFLAMRHFLGFCIYSWILPMAAVNLSFSFRTPSVTHLHGALRAQTKISNTITPFPSLLHQELFSGIMLLGFFFWSFLASDFFLFPLMLSFLKDLCWGRLRGGSCFSLWSPSWNRMPSLS